MQLHRSPLGLQFLVRSTDVTQAAGAGGTIVHPSFRDESNGFAREKDPAEVLAIIISQELGVPRTGGFRQFTTNEPRSCLHVKILAHLVQQPLTGRQITPQSSGNELRPI